MNPNQNSSMFVRYRLLSRLGEGAMGEVWKAHDLSLGRTVALKRIRSDWSHGRETVARFLREATTMAQLRHPGIVGVYDAGEADEGLYLAMELIEGPTFADWLAAAPVAEDPNRLRAAVEILAAVAEAVGHAHAHGILHRDLKPGNLLIDVDGRPHVADFGLARRFDHSATGRGSLPERLTVSGQLLGSPAYMSPEQVEGVRELDPRCDVWALGVMLYQALTGRLPHGGTSMEVLSHVVSQDVPRPREVRAGIPEDLEAVCCRALDRTPQRRYPDGAALAFDLRAWLAGERVRATRTGIAWLASRFGRRHRRALAGVAVTLLAVCSLAIAVRLDRKAREAYRNGLLESAGRGVLSFEDAVYRTRLSPEAQSALAEQPLRLIEVLAAQADRPGTALSWRGRVWEILGQSREADEAFDRGCAEAPEEGLTWTLRGISRLERYMRLRGAPAVVAGVRGIEFRPMRPETPAEAALRTGGLADLERAARAAAEPWVERELAAGGAMAVLAAHGASGGAEALRLLEGAEGARAERWRGLSLHYLGRFGDAAAAFRRLLERWPFDPFARVYLGFTRYAAAVEQSTNGVDPRPALREAIVEFGLALELAPDSSDALLQRAGSRCMLGLVEASMGRDAGELFRDALADLDRALEVRPSDRHALYTRGTYHCIVADQQRMFGGPAEDSYRRALADLNRVVDELPEFADARANRGSARMGIARLRQARGENSEAEMRAALEDLDAALAAEPDFLEAAANRAGALAELAGMDQAAGRDPRPGYRRAIEALEPMLARRPDLALQRVNRALLHLRCAQAEVRAGGDPAPHFRAALEDSTAALKVSTDIALAHYYRGLAHAQLGAAEAKVGGDPLAFRLAGACDLEAAIGKGLPAASAELARLYAVLGRSAEAASLASPGATDASRDMAAPLVDAGSWQAAMTRAGTASRAGDREAAAVAYQAVLDAVEAGLAGLDAPSRRARLADAALGTAFAQAHLALACRKARTAPDAAFRHLAECLDAGWRDADRLEFEPDLAPLRADPRWAEIRVRGR